MLVLVRIFLYPSLRGRIEIKPGTYDTARTGGNAINGISKVGNHYSVHDAGYAECHSAGSDVHLPVEKTKSGGEG